MKTKMYLASLSNQKPVRSVAQSCLTLCDPVDCSPPGSFVHGISQTRMLDWVVIFSCSGSSWPRDRTCISYIAGKYFTAEPAGESPKASLNQGPVMTKSPVWKRTSSFPKPVVLLRGPPFYPADLEDLGWFSFFDASTDILSCEASLLLLHLLPYWH